MPGRTPAEAFRAFIEPLEAAVACLGRAKITVSPKGRSSTEGTHAWSLNQFSGMAFSDGHLFQAEMAYKFVPHEDGWRVTTQKYIYSLLKNGEELWTMHWHPEGSSPWKTPHLHVGYLGGKEHLPVPRMAFEQAVEWVIAAGIEPAREDWKSILDASLEIHLEHRTW